MSFTDQKMRIATAEECKARWGCGKPGERFRCYLCGHKFAVGDQWRWVFDNNGQGAGYGNIMVCGKCDGDDVRIRWKARVDEFRSEKFWALQERAR